MKGETITDRRDESIAGVLPVWESKGKPGDSEVFYRQEVERVIEHYKSKLPRN